MSFTYPLLLQSVSVPKVWAGDHLHHFRAEIASPAHIGEVWDLSTWPTAPDDPHLDTMSYICNGPLAGLPLDQVARIPVVAKVIDSGALLSVQCHPQQPDRHKNEAWYVFTADPDAYLYLGLAPSITPAQFCRFLRESPPDEQKILGAMRCIRNLRAGMHFCILAPTVHALGPGLLTFEVSERTQITYRLYDYGRQRSQGKLDIETGCRAMATAASPPPPLQPVFAMQGARCETLSAFSTFAMLRLTGQYMHILSASHQHLVTACTSACVLHGPTPEWKITLAPTCSCLVPAISQAYTIDTSDGVVLLTALRDSSE